MGAFFALLSFLSQQCSRMWSKLDPPRPKAAQPSAKWRKSQIMFGIPSPQHMTPIKACRFETFGLIEAPGHKREEVGGYPRGTLLLKSTMEETKYKHAHAHSGMQTRTRVTLGGWLCKKHRREGGAGKAPRET